MPARLALAALLVGVATHRPADAKTPHRAVTVSVSQDGAVFALPPGLALNGLPETRREGDTLTLAFPGAGNIKAPGEHGAVLVQGGRDRATLVLPPGSTTRLWRSGNTLVVDVSPPPAPAAPVAQAAQAAQAAPAAPAAPVAPAPDDHPPPPPPEPDPGGALRAVRLPGPGDAILLPLDPQIGAAAFAYAGLGHAVFDDGKAIDLSGLKDDPVFGAARITLSPGTTHLAMPMPPGTLMALHRLPAGWALSVERALSGRASAKVRLQGGVVSVAMKQAAGSLVLADPATGGKLLVGTVHDHGDSVLVPHVSPEFALLPGWEGVVIRAISDRLALVPVKAGFALREAAGPPLVSVMTDDSRMALENAGTLTRRFDLPPLPVPALLHRMEADLYAAAIAPKQGRFRPRLRAAQDMLALGLDREAGSVLQAAGNDDPSQLANPDAGALLAMARFLAGLTAPEDAAAIGNPALGGSDEITLWRAMMAQPASDIAARAALAAADWRLLTAYPAPLRNKLLPLVATLLLDGGQTQAAADLLSQADAPALTARLLRAQGKTAQALAALDRLAAGPDRKLAAQALRDATEMRLAGKSLSPAQAANVLTQRLFLWRDPAFELQTRLRISDLLAQASDFRGALAQLRVTAAMFPQAQDSVHDAEQRVVRALVQAGAGAALTPVDLVALVDENTDLLGQGSVAASLTPILVDKLAALDLPERAEKLVSKLIDATAQAAPKAALGARLAALRLDDSDAAGALAALDQTAGADLPDRLDGQRVVLRARALAALGEIAPALSLLAGHDSDDALQLQAALLEKTKDWRGAQVVLQTLVHQLVPASAALSAAQQDLVLRLAGAASQNGDSAALRDLTADFASRLTGAPATLFETLTARPVRGTADLARAGREAASSRALPAAIAGYTAH
jgi:hypothetical protein